MVVRCVSSRVNAFSTISHTKAVKAFIPRSHRKRVIDFLSPLPPSLTVVQNMSLVRAHTRYDGLKSEKSAI